MYVRRVALVCLVVTTLAACGGKPFPRVAPRTSATPDPQAARTLANAVRATLASGSAASEFSRATGSVTTDSRGSQDFRRRVSEVKTTVIGRDAAGHPVDFALEARVVGDHVYVKVPSAQKQAFGNPKTPWVSTTLHDLKVNGHELFGVDIIALVTSVPEPGVTRLETGGRASYGGAIALLGVARALPSDLRKRVTVDLNAQIRLLENAVGTNPSFTAFVDTHGRLASVQLRSTVPGSKSSLTLTFSSFGVPVHVVAPPPSQVSPAPRGLAVF